MSFLKRLFVKHKTSWIIIDIDDDGNLSKQSQEGKHILLYHPCCDGPRDFELLMSDANKIVMRWSSGIASEYQIEVDASGINRSLFDNVESFILNGRFQKLIPKERFFWRIKKTNDEGVVTYERKEIPAEKLDDSYELYRIIFYFYWLCLNNGYDKTKMAASGTFYIRFPGSDASKQVFERLFMAYLTHEQCLPDDADWDIIICDKIIMETPSKIITKEGSDRFIVTIETEYSPKGVIESRVEKLGDEICPGLLMTTFYWYNRYGKRRGELCFHGL